MKPSFKMLLAVVLLVAGSFLVARFFNENSESIQVQFLYWRTNEISKGALIGIVFLLGISVAALLAFSTVLSKSFEVSRLRRENQALRRLVESREDNKNLSQNAV
jgi:uncharacterized integral membrane protein